MSIWIWMLQRSHLAPNSADHHRRALAPQEPDAPQRSYDDFSCQFRHREFKPPENRAHSDSFRFAYQRAFPHKTIFPLRSIPGISCFGPPLDLHAGWLDAYEKQCINPDLIKTQGNSKICSPRGSPIDKNHTFIF